MIVLPTEYSLSNDKKSPLASIVTETWALQAFKLRQTADSLRPIYLLIIPNQPPSTVGLLTLRSPVVVLVEHILGRIQPVRDDTTRHPVVPVLGDPRFPNGVGRPTLRTLAHMVVLSVLTGGRVFTDRALLADETGTGPSVDRLSDQVSRRPPMLGSQQWPSTVVITDRKPRSIDVVLDDRRNALTDSVHSFALILVLQRCVGLRAMDELNGVFPPFEVAVRQVDTPDPTEPGTRMPE